MCPGPTQTDIHVVAASLPYQLQILPPLRPAHNSSRSSQPLDLLAPPRRQAMTLAIMDPAGAQVNPRTHLLQGPLLEMELVSHQSLRLENSDETTDMYTLGYHDPIQVHDKAGMKHRWRHSLPAVAES